METKTNLAVLLPITASITVAIGLGVALFDPTLDRVIVSWFMGGALLGLAALIIIVPRNWSSFYRRRQDFGLLPRSATAVLVAAWLISVSIGLVLTTQAAGNRPSDELPLVGEITTVAPFQPDVTTEATQSEVARPAESQQANEADAPLASEVDESDAPLRSEVDEMEGPLASKVDETEAPVTPEVDETDAPLASKVGETEDPLASKVD